jgi:signal transduction histidine kinase
MQERNRLARDLHDSVTQSLYGVTLYVEVAAQLLKSGELEKTGENLKELKKMALDALAEMRLLIYELRPSVFEEEGLVAAIQTRLDAVEGRVGLETNFVIEGEISLPPQVEEGLYRITQEALNNVLKHSHASSVTLTLAQDEHMIHLEVVDDGVGFDPTKTCEAGCLGLRGMQERAQEMGAELEIVSQAGSGTKIIVRSPIP